MTKDGQNREDTKILRLADYSEKINVGGSTAWLIINQKLSEHPCMFGFLTLENNLENTKVLFDKICARAKELGQQDIIGPMNYNTWFPYRIAISGFDLQLFPDCNNPEYYAQLLQKCGFRELYTYRSTVIKLGGNPLLKLAQEYYLKNSKKGFAFRTYHNQDAKMHTQEIYRISTSAFVGSHLYAPILYDEFSNLYLEWTNHVDVELYVAYHRERPIGFVFGYPNPYGPQYIVKTVAVLPEFQGKGIYLSLMHLCCDDLLKNGYDAVVAHFQCEQKKGLMRFPEQYELGRKRYAIYIKDL